MVVRILDRRRIGRQPLTDGILGKEDAMHMFICRPALAIVLILAVILPAGAQSLPPGVPQPGAPLPSNAARMLPVLAAHGAVSSQEHLATEVGVDILKRGGNAVDAAVAVGFALAVTHPVAGNLGGGGFMLVYLARTRQTVAIDYREVAPKAATRDMFLDARGDPDPQKSRYSGLAIGVPGSVRGLAEAETRYGSRETASPSSWGSPIRSIRRTSSATTRRAGRSFSLRIDPCRAAPRSCSPTSPTRWKPSPDRARMPFIAARLPKG
jgi:hypothetical protein